MLLSGTLDFATHTGETPASHAHLRKLKLYDASNWPTSADGLFVNGRI